jgi:hypothetical protein
LRSFLSIVLSITCIEPSNQVEIENYGSYTFFGGNPQCVLVSY